jgi:fatty acid desaturase
MNAKILKNRADLRPLAFNAIYFALLSLAFSSAVSLDSTPAVALLALLGSLCITAFQGAVQTHNAIHCPVFAKRWMNKIYQCLLTHIYGHPVSSYVPGHRTYHCC